MMVVQINWERAREDPAFRQRILEVHSAFAFTRRFKQFSAKMDHEVLRLLGERGHETSENWLTDFDRRVEPELLDTPVKDTQ